MSQEPKKEGQGVLTFLFGSLLVWLIYFSHYLKGWMFAMAAKMT